MTDLRQLIATHKSGRSVGIPSICSASRFVLEAAMLQAKADGTPVLIESTSNQVNQFGGYTGQTAAQFASFVREVAKGVGFPPERVILGGDHLGPNAWQKEPAAVAMPKSLELVRSCILAGYTKIHLDASMRLADDPGGKNTPLAEETITARAVEMAAAAEEAHGQLPAGSPAPVYIIGTEVPIPGGEQSGHNVVSVTNVDDARRTIEMTREAFEARKLHAAWERVIGVVVQPGVEFGDATVVEYHREKAAHLRDLIGFYPGLVWEAHSTDYQTPAALRQLVEDHFAILKVGPWLTFALREALFALEDMERALLCSRTLPSPAPGSGDPGYSDLRITLERAMQANPVYWKSYYSGDESQQRLARQFSFSDRLRYYWPVPEVQQSVARLIQNLEQHPAPLSLLSQYLPTQYAAVREGQIHNTPRALIHHKIMEVVGVYAKACGA